MPNFDDGLDLLVSGAQAIATLIELLEDDADNLYAFHYDYPTSTNLAKAIYDQEFGTILFAHRATTYGKRGGYREHEYFASIKPRGLASRYFDELRNGIGAGGRPFYRQQLSIDFEPPNFTGMFLRTIAIEDRLVCDYYEAPIVLTERGVDQ